MSETNAKGCETAMWCLLLVVEVLVVIQHSVLVVGSGFSAKGHHFTDHQLRGSTSLC